jgi:hypothetical protein
MPPLLYVSDSLYSIILMEAAWNGNQSMLCPEGNEAHLSTNS